MRMDDLRSAYRDAGFVGVETHIATGNVIFDAPKCPNRDAVERVVADRFGFVSEAFIRDSAELISVVERNPWSHPEALVEVSFLEDVPVDGDARALEATVTTPEDLVVSGAEVFFLREGKGIPTVHKESTTERHLGMRTTRRGMATVRQIADRFLT